MRRAAPRRPPMPRAIANATAAHEPTLQGTSSRHVAGPVAQPDGELRRGRADLDDRVDRDARRWPRPPDRLGRRRLVEAVGAPAVGDEEREQPAHAFAGVDLVDQRDVVAGQLELLGEGALDHEQRHQVIPRSVGVGGGFGAVGAARLAQDAADVVGGGVLADAQRPAELAVAHPARDQPEDLRLARGEPVREPVRRPSGGPSARTRLQQRGHADALGEPRRPRRAAPAPRRRSARPRRAGSARTRRRCARTRSARPCAGRARARVRSARRRAPPRPAWRRASRGSDRRRRSRRRGGRSSRCRPRSGSSSG